MAMYGEEQMFCGQYVYTYIDIYKAKHFPCSNVSGMYFEYLINEINEFVLWVDIIWKPNSIFATLSNV